MNEKTYGLYLIPLSILAVVLSKLLSTYMFIILYILWFLYLFWKKAFSYYVLFLSGIFLLTFYFYFPNPFEINFLTNKNHFIQLEGKITSSLIEKNGRKTFRLQEYNSKQIFHIVYFTNKNKKDELSIYHGSICKLKGKLNDTMQATNPGQFDYEWYLKKQGIVAEIILDNKDDIICEGRSLISYLHSAREILINDVENKFKKTTSEWIKALLFGDRSNLDDEIVHQFQHWGLAHLLAISGLHVSILLGLFYFFLVRCNIVTKETAELILIFILPLYIFIAGSSPSVWRSVLTVIMILVIKRIHIKIALIDILSIVFTCLILINPFQIYDIGFQFSFLVTFSILLSRNWLQTDSYFYQSLRLSYISQMIITPLQLYYFHNFQPLGILLNIIIVPFFSLLFLPFILLMFVTSYIFPFSTPIFELIFSLLQFILLKPIQLLKSFEKFSFLISNYSFSMIVTYYIVLYFSMFLLEHKRNLYAFICKIFLIVIIILPKIIPYLQNEGLVTMLDVDQSETIVIELPKRKAILLYDIGALFSFKDKQVSEGIYKDVIKPFLIERNITKIDYIFLSHEDIDHVGSLPFLLEDFAVKKIILSPYFKISKDLHHAFEKNNVTVKRIQEKEQLIIGEYYFRVISPAEDMRSENENSLIVQTNLGGMNWLFTGDAGKKTERKLIKRYPNLQVDILKVGHHGSENSTDDSFLKHIQPKYSLISAGRNNHYGHPTEKTLNLLKKYNVEIFRTDKNGAIQFKFNKTDGTFIPFIP